MTSRREEEEEDKFKIEWNFLGSDKTATTTVDKDGCGLLFHHNFSSGTAVIRCKTPLPHDHHSYWELEMQSLIYGSAVMVGVGTQHAPYDTFQTIFAPVIGINQESWG